ncbi:MAG: hypothetical protein JNM42_13655 [Propionivibrio sp.]|nr:hypothetical protein [Propionivibrio sp.]
MPESFKTIWRTAESYRGSLSPPTALVGTVVSSRALDFLRRRNAKRAHVTQSIDNDMPCAHADGAPDPMGMALSSAQVLALHQCPGKIEHRQREMASLAYLLDLSLGDLAAQLKRPLGRRCRKSAPCPQSIRLIAVQ